jgi:hypothetical protein
MPRVNLDKLTDEQCKIADALWACDTFEETEELVESGGIEVAKIRSLLMFAFFDDVPHTTEALNLLKKFKK